MTNTNGLTQHDYKVFEELLIKANYENLKIMEDKTIQDMNKR